jgi:RNA polymerase sigma-70 factor, ECF subfamily
MPLRKFAYQLVLKVRCCLSAVMTSAKEVTQLLLDWNNGNEDSLNQLMPLVYAELRRMARLKLAGQNEQHTLQPTALIHEAYIRLVGVTHAHWEGRPHFFRVAAKAMRHVLIDHARARLSRKRHGDQHDITLAEERAVSEVRMASIVALDDALTDLQRLNKRQAAVVELKYFGGLTVEETADALHVSTETVSRDWRAAKAWLLTQLASTRTRHETTV